MGIRLRAEVISTIGEAADFAEDILAILPHGMA